MASCPNCGKDVQAGMSFCPTCGFRLSVPITTTAGQTTPKTTQLGVFLVPTLISLVLISLVLIGIGAGLYAIPGYDQASTYCGSIYAHTLCDDGRAMIANGVILALVGLIIIIFAGYWFRHSKVRF